jgi:hypothetical protein
MNNVTPLLSYGDAFNTDRNLERFTTGYAAPAYYLWRRRKACTAPSDCVISSPCTTDSCSQGIAETCINNFCGKSCGTSADCIAGRQTCDTASSVCVDTPAETLRKVAYHYHYGIFRFTGIQGLNGYSSLRGDLSADDHKYLSYPPLGSCASDANCQTASGETCQAGFCREKKAYDDYVDEYRTVVENEDYGGQAWAGNPATPPYINQLPAVSIRRVVGSASPSNVGPGESTWIDGTAYIDPNMPGSGFQAQIDLIVFNAQHQVVGVDSQVVEFYTHDGFGYWAFEWNAPTTYSGPYHVEVGVRESWPSSTLLYYDSQASAGFGHP